MNLPCLRLLFLIFVLFPVTGWARNTGVSGTDLEFYRPSIDPYGYFGVNGPNLLKGRDIYFKLSQSFAFKHLFQVSVDGVPNDIVNHVFTTDLIASVGISDFLTAGLDLPLHLYAREADFDTLTPFTTASVGDLRMALKFRLLEEKGRLPGLALLVTTSFPTGDEAKFLGTSHFVPGAELIAGKNFKYFSLAFSFGALFPWQKSVLGVSFDDQIVYGVAVKVPIVFLDPMLSFLGEIRGHFEPGDLRILTAPVEFTAGVKKEFQNGLAVTAGAGGAWNNAIGNPRIRGIVAVSYALLPSKHDEAWAARKAEKEERRREVRREEESRKKERERAKLEMELQKKALETEKIREELRKRVEPTSQSLKKRRH